jgi:hypothetical protein
VGRAPQAGDTGSDIGQRVCARGAYFAGPTARKYKV